MKDLTYYRSLPYTRLSQPFRDENGHYWLAWIDELEGCKADGETQVEAFANLEEVFDDYIAAKREWDSIVPEPAKPPVRHPSVAATTADTGMDIHVHKQTKMTDVAGMFAPEEEAAITGGTFVAA